MTDPLKDFANISNENSGAFGLSILDFANKYGLLTHKHSLSSLWGNLCDKYNNDPQGRKIEYDETGLDPFKIYRVTATSIGMKADDQPMSETDRTALFHSWIEPLKIWHIEYSEINTILHIWEMITNRRHDLIKNLIQWHKNGYRYAFSSLPTIRE